MKLASRRSVSLHAVPRYSHVTHGTLAGKHGSLRSNGFHLAPVRGHHHHRRRATPPDDHHDRHPTMPQQKRVGGGHAILHDFCLVSPYGLLLVLVGFIGVATPGAVKFGWLTTAAGLAQMLLSSRSLGSWKSGGNHRIFTSLCLGLAALLAWVSSSLFRRGAFTVVSGSAGVLSGVISLFLIHNLVAGGNKPPSQKHV